MHNRKFTGLVLLVPSLIGSLTTDLAAQRVDAEFRWQEHKITLSYGAVRFGKRSLKELKVGSDWRMGQNDATTLETSLPLVGEHGIVAPGSYRVALHRAEDRLLALRIFGAELVTGATPLFPAPLQEDEEATDKLELAFDKGGKPDKPGKGSERSKADKDKEVAPASADGKTAGTTAAKDPFDGNHAKVATLDLAYGPFRLAMPIGVVGGHSVKVRGFTAQAFTWPQQLFVKHLDKDRALPILTLRGKGGSKSRPRIFNLMVSAKKAEFVPAMTAPTDHFGFAPSQGPAADEILAGSVEWIEAQDVSAYLEVSDIKVKRRELVLTLRVGKKRATITAPMPSAR